MLTEDQRSSQPYHHGNVKEALIDVAMKFIEANEVELISLRRLAREVGITPSAVYNHFDDKDALMLAIKLKLYEEFNCYFEARSSDTDNSEQALLEMCLSYYHFSQEFPSRFLFLFNSILPLEWSTPEMVEVSCRSIVKTRKLILQIYEKYRIPCGETDVVNTTLLVWSQLHGIVTLKNSGSIKAAVAYQNWPQSCALVNDDEAEQLIRNYVEMTVNAILNTQHSESHH